MYFSPEATIKASEEFGLRSLIGLVVFDMSPNSQPKTIEAKFDKLQKMKLQTTNFSIAPHAIYTVGKENLKWSAAFAKKKKLPLHIHLSETQGEVENCLNANKKRPVQYLNDLGFLNERSIFAHSVWLDGEEKKLLGQKKCVVVNNQSSNFKLAVGEIIDIAGLQKAGATITLGTDGSASNNNLDMLQEMKISALAQKHKQNDACAFSAQEVFQAATKNGAQAVGLNGGEIKVGKLADFILLDLNKLSLMPGFNLVSDLVYAAAGDVVSDVIINGKIILQDYYFANINENLIKKKAKSVALDIAKRK